MTLTTLPMVNSSVSSCITILNNNQLGICTMYVYTIAKTLTHGKFNLLIYQYLTSKQTELTLKFGKKTTESWVNINLLSTKLISIEKLNFYGESYMHIVYVLIIAYYIAYG